MNIKNYFLRHAAALFSALLVTASFTVYADDIQDANNLFKQGQHSQALDKVNNILSGKPKDAQARFLKGLIFTEQGKPADAIKTFLALTEDYPDLPEPYNNLAVLYASQSQYDKAKLALEKAIRTHPSYATAYENLGDIYAKMASQAYDRALQLDRSNTTTKTKLAMIQDLFSSGTRPKSPTPVKTAAADTPGANKPQIAAPAVGEASTAVQAPAQTAPQAKTGTASEKSASTGKSDEVLKTVNAWATAWSAKDVKKYLSFYAADFKTPDGEKRANWENSRKERISKPKSIHVSINKPTVSFSDNDHATVKFQQSYQANHLKTLGKKTLLMVKSDGKWLIREEHTK